MYSGTLERANLYARSGGRFDTLPNDGSRDSFENVFIKKRDDGKCLTYVVFVTHIHHKHLDLQWSDPTCRNLP
jgi:hypothetical protein